MTRHLTLFLALGSVILLAVSCASLLSSPTDSGKTQQISSVPPVSQTLPSPVTSLITGNAYDGKVNLWWNRSATDNIDCYNVYVSNSRITDVTGNTPFQTIADISATSCQIVGLKDGTEYHVAITVVEKDGNENKQVTSAAVTPLLMPRGAPGQDFIVDRYFSDKVWAGTTLLPDNHNLQKPRIIEVNMLGEVIWEYVIPQHLRQYTNPGFDVELLDNSNILFVLPRNGVYEINRSGKIIWSYLTDKISHDADRLPNGNTVFAFGAFDQKTDAQVTEINSRGDTVWSWHAGDYFDKAPFNTIFVDGWTHTNAVTRLSSGNTLVCPRNFNLIVEVDSRGKVIRTIGEGVYYSTHDPEVLDSGTILAVSQYRDKPHQAIEINPVLNTIVWEYGIADRRAWPVRDANRLPNGNTLITGSTEIIEVTSQGQVVWSFRFNNIPVERGQAPARGFYKAQRIYKGS